MMRCTACFLGLALLAGYARAEAPQAPRPFVVAIDNYPPYEYIEDGEAVGLDIDVIRTAMGRLGVPVTFELYPWPRAWLMLTKGQVDAVASVSYQPYREDHIWYADSQRILPGATPQAVDYLWITEYVFFIHRRFSGSLHFESYAQLERDGYRVGVIKGYSYDDKFQAANLDRVTYASQKAVFQALAEGIVDVVPFDRTTGMWLLRQNGMDRLITFLPSPLFRKPYILGFGRQSDFPAQRELMQRFNAEVRAMRASGEWEALRRKHQTVAFEHEADRTLTFVCENWAPFEYVEDGVTKGINVEVVDYIMGRLGIPYQIEVYPWSRAWMLAEKGKADAVLSVSYKASREPVLLYTQAQREFAETGELPPDYLWLSEYVFFVKASRAAELRFESYAQLKQDGYRVGRNKDYTYDPLFLAADIAGPVYNDTDEGLLALVAEEIDLYPMDRTVGTAHLNAMGLTDSVTYLPNPLFRKPYLVPFCRRSDFPDIEGIMTAFNRELRLMRQSGEYKRVEESYLKGLRRTARVEE